MAASQRGRTRAFVALLLLFSAVLVPPATTRPATERPGLEVVGTFAGGVPITGAVRHGGYLYVTTTFQLSIFDIRVPLEPRLVSSAISPNPIHGELLPTNGSILLLNDGLGRRTLNVWDVEDKSNPVLVGEIRYLGDEHFSCVKSCAWAYGSLGSIVDLRDPAHPEKATANWKERAGIWDDVHRVDEYRPGHLVTAPRHGPPIVIDARDPLRPRKIARAGLPTHRRSGIIYSSWPLEGRARYLLSAVEYQESGSCSDKAAGMLLAFDTEGYPTRSKFPLAGRLEREGSDCRGRGAYFEPNPSFERNGLLVLPIFEGVVVLELDERGRLTETGSFDAPIGLLWHAFWVTDEILYVLNSSGEIYILRYG